MTDRKNYKKRKNYFQQNLETVTESIGRLYWIQLPKDSWKQILSDSYFKWSFRGHSRQIYSMEEQSNFSDNIFDVVCSYLTGMRYTDCFDYSTNKTKSNLDYIRLFNKRMSSFYNGTEKFPYLFPIDEKLMEEEKKPKIKESKKIEEKKPKIKEKKSEVKLKKTN